MSSVKIIAILACTFLTLSVASNAISLEKRHLIGLRLGMWNQVANVRTEVGVGGVSTSVGSDGFLGGVSYGHWLKEDLALNISVGGMMADVETRVGLLGVSHETAAVTHILVGLKQYFPKSTYGSSVRPFVKASLGPYIGSQTRTETGLVVSVESRSEPAFGGQAGVGVDFVVGRHFLTGISVGYNLMNDFDEPIGGSKNYSGPEFSLGFSYLFGKGTD